MGVAYRAWDARLARPVALKTLHRRAADDLFELKTEFRRLAGLSHPNLVQLYELFASDGECFFTMELIDGRDLVGALRGHRPAREPPDPALLAAVQDAFRQLAHGLRALHDSGHSHRDLKPSNVMVDTAGRLVLLDFGRASSLHDTRLRAGPSFPGALAYAAPEEIAGAPASAAGDWHAVGALLFEVLTGEPPYQGSFEELLRLERSDHPPRPSQRAGGIPPALDDLVVRLLARDAARRPAAAALLGVLADAAARGTPPAPPPRSSGPFVGRDQELAQLEQWLAEVRTGKAAVGHVRGVSGVGKSELVQHFLAAIPAAAALVLRGRCHPQESVPFKALDAVVDDLSLMLLDGADVAVPRLPAEERELLGRLFPVLQRVPELASHPVPETAEDPHELRRRGFLALRGLLARLGAASPLVLWVDDAQWGDPDSAALLRAVLAAPEPPRVLLLLSYRAGEERGALLPLLEGIGGGVPLAQHVLELGPLDPEQTAALAERMLGTLVLRTHGVKDRIAAEAGGSPFFVGELVRHLAQRGGPVEGSADVLGIAAVTMARVELLNAEALLVLELVAVAAGPVGVDVVLDAAGVGSAGWPLVLGLCGQCLLREVGSRDAGDGRLDAYHDRIREAVQATFAQRPELLRAHHLRLAEALLARPASDPRLLLQHLLGAGDETRAAEQALRAAERAAASLAFERAAELQATALRLRGERAQDWPLRAERAHMLAAAGRNATAARLLEDAAGQASRLGGDAASVTALHGRAAEQFLYAGLLADGTRVLQAALAELGVAIPRDPRAAMRWSLAARLRFLVRGSSLRSRGGSPVAPRDLLRLDALYGAARGTVMLDHRLADALAMRHLLGALDLGEPSRALRALCMEAAAEANVGGRWLRRRSVALLEQAAELAARTGEPYDRAVVLLHRGAVALFSARFRAAAAECAEALEIFRTRCAGASWEITVCHSFLVAALTQLGHVRELGERTRTQLGAAVARGDRYSIAFFQSGDCVLEALGRDDPAGAVEGADAALAGVPAEHFTSLHFGHLVAVVRVHLYTGDGARAWALIEDAWPRLRAGGFLSLEGLGVVLHYLRGCAALAAAERLLVPGAAPRGAGRSTRTLLRQAARAARRLRRVTLPTGPALALALAAGVHALRGEGAQRVAALEHAVTAFGAVEMELHRESARLLLGLARGSAADEERARAWMHEQTVRDPLALARATVPGPYPGALARRA